MANVLLGVTGSVAAVRTPALYQALTQAGHAGRVVATYASLYFFGPAEVAPSGEKVVTIDADEWPGRDSGRRYQRDEPVLHIELRRWAELFVIAPLDANTLAKLVNGICDNCLTCVWRAWDPKRPVVVAPAMNTLMWEHPLTKRQIRQLGIDAGAAHIPSHMDDEHLIAAINERSKTLQIVSPITKTLACGDVGVGAMAEVEAIADAVEAIAPRLSSGPVCE